MNIIKIFYLIALCFLIVSCNKKLNQHGGFPETIEVVTHQQDFDSVFLKYPYRVKVAGTSIYVTDLHPLEYFCHEFEYPSLKYIRSFAKRGRGPHEVTDVATIIVNKDILYLLDTFKRRIYIYNGNSLDNIVDLPEEIGLSVDFTPYNDSIFILPDYLGKHRLIFVGLDGKILRYMGNIPGKEHASIPEVSLGQMWRPFIHYNPNNNILALVTQLGEVLEIYHLDNGQSKVVVGKGGEPKYRHKGSGGVVPDGIRGYTDVFVGDKYIYALFWGYTFEDIINRKITTQGGNIIHVFDLEGNPVRQYIIDRYITGFYINEVTREVIGPDVNEGDLVFFSL